MKVVLLIILLLIGNISFAQNLLLPDVLRMESCVRLEPLDSIFRNPYKTFRYSESKSLNQLIFNHLLTGKSKVYNILENRNFGLYSPYSEPMSKEDLDSRMGSYVSSSSGVDQLLYYAPSVYTIFGFEEKWFFDGKLLSLEKQVDNIKVYRESEDPETGMMRTFGVCTIPNNPVPSDTPDFSADISYEQSLLLPIDWVNNENESSFIIKKTNAGLLVYSNLYDFNFFTEYSRKQLIESLCTSVYSGKLKAVDFNTRQALDSVEISKRLGAETAKVLTLDDKGNEQLKEVTIPPSLQDIDAVIFTEKWTFDSSRFSFKKEVREIALEKYTYSYEDTLFLKPLRQICFSIILNKGKPK
jgi:hypothetical protein